MEIKLIDPRLLVENPGRARRSKSSPQFDALLLAPIKAVGIVQPPHRRLMAATVLSSTPGIAASSRP